MGRGRRAGRAIRQLGQRRRRRRRVVEGSVVCTITLYKRAPHFMWLCATAEVPFSVCVLCSARLRREQSHSSLPAYALTARTPPYPPRCIAAHAARSLSAPRGRGRGTPAAPARTRRSQADHPLINRRSPPDPCPQKNGSWYSTEYGGGEGVSVPAFKSIPSFPPGTTLPWLL